MTNSMQTQAAGASHVGLVRGNNEDAYAIAEGIWVVADGLGGHAGGEVASRLAVDAAVDALTSGGGPDPAAALAAAFRAAHEPWMRWQPKTRRSRTWARPWCWHRGPGRAKSASATSATAAPTCSRTAAWSS